MGRHEVEDTMTYAEKIERLEHHLSEHPKDYQAVVALLKRRSEMIEHRMWLKMIARRKAVAEVRRARKEKRDAKEC